MPKSKSRKIQKAGDWSSWMSNLGQNARAKLFGVVNTVDSGLGNAWEGTKSFGSNVGSNLGLTSSPSPPPSTSYYQPEAPQPEVPQQQQPPVNAAYGGKRRTRKMKGGKGGLGLTYYASPVSGLKVAEPTYWEVYGNGHIMKAGSKSRKNHSKNKKHSRRHKNKKH